MGSRSRPGGNFPGSFAPPSWDCNNTGAGGNGDEAATGTPSELQEGSQACWVAPPLDNLLGQNNASKFPHLTAAQYSKK